MRPKIAKLRTQVRRLDDFAELTPTAFWELDAALRYTFVSARYEQIMGLAPRHLLGRPYPQVHGRSVVTTVPWAAHLRHLERRQDFRDFTYAIRRSGRQTRVVRSSGQALFDAEGVFIGYRGATVDISEEVEARASAESVEMTFVGVIESLTQAVVVHDARDRLLLCNSVYREFHFYNYDLLVPGSDFEQRVRQSVARGAIPDAVGREEDWIVERIGKHRQPCGVFEQRLEDGRWLQIGERRTADGGCVGVHADITELRRRHEEVRLSRERLRNLAERLQAVREQERAAISREIHDELGQAITGMKMDLAIVREAVPEEAELACERVDALNALLDDTIETVRRLARRLRPTALDDIGLCAAIEAQVQEFAARTGCRCFCDLRARDLKPSHERDLGVFRIFQEALTNVARHAHAKRVRVRLWINDVGELLLEVIDNGRGIRRENVADTRSLGIIGMRERGGALGGRVYIDPMPGRGTVVRLWLPLGRPRRRIWPR